MRPLGACSNADRRVCSSALTCAALASQRSDDGMSAHDAPVDVAHARTAARVDAGGATSADTSARVSHEPYAPLPGVDAASTRASSSASLDSGIAHEKRTRADAGELRRGGGEGGGGRRRGGGPWRASGAGVRSPGAPARTHAPISVNSSSTKRRLDAAALAIASSMQTERAIASDPISGYRCDRFRACTSY